MTSLDRVKEAVRKRALDDGADQLRARLSKQGEVGRLVLRLAWLDPDPEARPPSFARIVRAIDGLTASERASLFDAISPSIGELIRHQWEDGRSGPILVGDIRRPYRAPRAPMASTVARVLRLEAAVRFACVWDEPIEWLAEHGGYLDGHSSALGGLVVAGIDHAPASTADRLAEIVVAQARNSGLPGAMSDHTITALLGSSRQRLWDEAVELLLSAQRQEGLRRWILTAAILGHPDAFRRIVATVAEQGYARFASTAKACSEWFGEPFESRDRNLLDRILGNVSELLADHDLAMAQSVAADPAEARLALWAVATRDAYESGAALRELLDRDDPRARIVALRHVDELGHIADYAPFVPSLADPDERVRAVAFAGVTNWSRAGSPGDQMLPALVGLLKRTPDPITVSVGTWKPVELTLHPRLIADQTARVLAGRSPLAVEGLVPQMTPDGRSFWARRLAEDPKTHRQQLLALVGDAADDPRRVAIEALRGSAPTPKEAVQLEALLKRKPRSLRRAVLTLLLDQSADRIDESIARLRGGSVHQASAGDELAELVASQAEAGDNARSSAGPASPAALIDHGRRVEPKQPDMPDTSQLDAASSGTRLVISSLDGWLAEHANTEVEIATRGGERTVELLSNLVRLGSGLRTINYEQQERAFPIPDLVEPWWERIRGQLLDGCPELALAVSAVRVAIRRDDDRSRASRPIPQWVPAVERKLPGFATARKSSRLPVVGGLLSWIAARELTGTAVDVLLDAAELVLASIPDLEVARTPTLLERHEAGRLAHERPVDWRDRSILESLSLSARFEAIRPDVFSASQRRRLVRLMRFVDEPLGLQADPRMVRVERGFGPGIEVPDRPGRRPLPLRLTCRAHDQGVVNDAELVELLVGARYLGEAMYRRWDDVAAPPLQEVTRRARPRDLAEFRWLDGLVDRVRDAILDVELARGELPTPMTDIATSLRTMFGIDRVVQALEALGRQGLVRRRTGRGHDGKREVLSHLIRLSFPAHGETAEEFAAATTAAGLDDQRLIGLAIYAPQWAPFVEHGLGVLGITDAIHWVLAHTKDAQWHVDADVRDEWMARVHEQTALDPDDLVAGAVDVAWFERVRATLPDEQFDRLLKAAKYASSSGGHKRAELFALALRGDVSADELMERADEKRHQDSVRAVGLVPIDADPKARKAEVLRRWAWLQDWVRGSARFGRQRRASEALAARVATENLARTAGYTEPERLAWAMEAEAIRDLGKGPVTASAGDVSVTLSIDDSGQPDLTIERAGRTLKNVPTKVAKLEEIAALKERFGNLREQVRRIRRSLERAMIRGDRFEPEEFAELRRHAIARPMLDDVLVVDTTGALLRPSGDGFVTVTGRRSRRKPRPLRIAHPVDLFQSGHWHDWQHVLFTELIRQPFKQVFRELYLPTDAERETRTRSRRYAGHQVRPSQAIGLLGSRGWVVSRSGVAIRTFHDEGITARLLVLHLGWGVTVESTTIEDVVFTERGRGAPIALEDLPPRLFSEVMRDIDLVVSVAHASGFDPEASASTVEMRAALVRETVDLLRLENVELTGHHVMIRGTLGSYSVHLGSGTVHKRPGNALCIIPVGSQHRGRLFLPFVDDDPRSAEIVSKVVMLARDDTIGDPSIIAQIR